MINPIQLHNGSKVQLFIETQGRVSAVHQIFDNETDAQSLLMTDASAQGILTDYEGRHYVKDDSKRMDRHPRMVNPQRFEDGLRSIRMYAKSNGEYFQVVAISNTDDAHNALNEKHLDASLLVTDEKGRNYLVITEAVEMAA